jgi:hypothetical protein
MKKIIYTRPDGGLSVVHPAPNAKKEDESEDQFIERLVQKDVPADATNVRVVEAAAIPSDRSFRDAWKDEAGAIAVDMPKAREIHRNALRRLRKPKLEALDIEQLKNLGNAAKLADIELRKQALRDATADPSIEWATTAEELKAAIPPALA